MPPITFPGTYGLDFEWLYPEPVVVNQQLFQIEEYFKDTQVFAEEAKKIAQVDMAERFDTETDPDGAHWEALAKPAPEQIGILQLTGNMRNAAVSDEAWAATPEGVFFNTGALPLSESGTPYWIFHEQPDAYPSRRGMPQRKFIGLSVFAEQKIMEQADAWIAGGIYVGARGFIQERRSSIGRFAKL